MTTTMSEQPELKRLTPVVSAASGAATRLQGLHGRALALVPEALKPGVEQREEQLLALASPYLTVLSDRAPALLHAVDARVSWRPRAIDHGLAGLRSLKFKSTVGIGRDTATQQQYACHLAVVFLSPVRAARRHAAVPSCLRLHGDHLPSGPEPPSMRARSTAPSWLPGPPSPPTVPLRSTPAIPALSSWRLPARPTCPACRAAWPL